MTPATRAAAFINIAHFADHFLLLIFPTAVLTMGAEFGADYGSRIIIATGSFLAFGALSLPAGWLGDRWSRRHMLAVFYFGAGASLIFAGLAPSRLWLLAALSLAGAFAAIYHPVGSAMLAAVAGVRGRVFGRNGVFGNIGVALAAVTTGVTAQAFGWRWAFILPGIICLGLGLAYTALVPPGTGDAAKEEKVDDQRPVDRTRLKLIAAVLAVTAIAGGFTFNTATIALPQLVVERLPGLTAAPALAGLLATAILLAGAATQLTVGWLIDRTAIGVLFVALAVLQVAGFVGVIAIGNGLALVAAALILAAVYGQVIVNDMLVARNVPDRWRARAFATRYVLAFTASASVVPLIGLLHRPETGLTPVFAVMVGFAVAITLAALAYAVAGMRTARVARSAGSGAA